MIRQCRNHPEDGIVVLRVITLEPVPRWKAVDLTYQELYNAIAGGFEAQWIEDCYHDLERRLGGDL